MTSHRPRVLVMMATYNGAQWVSEQLDTILAQEGVDVFVRICDDLSNDETYEICRSCAQAHPNVVVTQNTRQYGVAENFMQMVYEEREADYDYYAFSDQDDIWLPNKLHSAVMAIEKSGEGDEPMLYYCDVTNVRDNERSSEIGPYRGCENHAGTVLVRNYVNGCAMVWNKALDELLRSYRPEQFYRIHDVWVHMAGRFCGKVIADLDHSYSLRRLTGQNVVGKKPLNVKTPRAIFELMRLAFPPYDRYESKLAHTFAKGFESKLNPEGKRILNEFVGYYTSMHGRIRMARSHDIWLPTIQMRLRVRIGFLLGFY